MTALEHSRAASPDELLMLLFSDPAVRADPYPVYHQLREMAPVHRSEVFPLWVVSSVQQIGEKTFGCRSALQPSRSRWFRILLAAVGYGVAAQTPM